MGHLTLSPIKDNGIPLHIDKGSGFKIQCGELKAAMGAGFMLGLWGGL